MKFLTFKPFFFYYPDNSLNIDENQIITALTYVSMESSHYITRHNSHARKHGFNEVTGMLVLPKCFRVQQTQDETAECDTPCYSRRGLVYHISEDPG